jgi:LPS-assembly lipoprotein
MRAALISVLAVMLCSCGFTLRGSENSQLPFSSIALNLQQENSPFSRLLRNALNSSSVAVGSDDGYTLSVSEEQQSIRPVSVTSRASAAQYELSSSVDIALNDAAGVAVIEPETLTVQKTYFEDIANIAGSNSEIELLRIEMRQELVNQLMRRLQFLPASRT